MRVIVSIERSRKSGLHRREAEAAVAEHHRGDAVPAGDRAVRVPADLGVVMGVQIDEARRDDQAVGVDDFLGEARRASADLRDLAVLDPDVAPVARHAGAVDDGAAFDLNVDSQPLIGSLLRWVRTVCKPLITAIRVTTLGAGVASVIGLRATVTAERFEA